SCLGASRAISRNRSVGSAESIRARSDSAVRLSWVVDIWVPPSRDVVLNCFFANAIDQLLRLRGARNPGVQLQLFRQANPFPFLSLRYLLGPSSEAERPQSRRRLRRRRGGCRRRRALTDNRRLTRHPANVLRGAL